MISRIKNFIKRIELGGIDDKLIYTILKMFSISTYEPPREEFFNSIGKDESYGYYAQVMKQVYVLGSKWKYGLAKSCELVAERVKNNILRDFLVRFSQILSLGENINTFLASELQTNFLEYSFLYDRMLEALKTLLGIYSTVMSSFMFLLVNIIVLSMLWGSGASIIIDTFIAIILSQAGLVFVIHKLVPNEQLLTRDKRFIKQYKSFQLTFLIALIISILMGIVAYFRTQKIELSMLIFGILLLLPGYLAKKLENYIKHTESYFPTFIRSFGNMLALVSLPVYALRSLLRSDFGPLTQPLKKLYARLSNGISEEIAWNFFVLETGSEMIRRMMNIFIETVLKGGKVSIVGNTIGDISERLIEMRKKREQAAKTFESVIYMLHSITVAIIVFITNLVTLLSLYLSNLKTIIPIVNVPGDIINIISISSIIAITILNALTIKIAQRGFWHTFWYYFAILMIISSSAVLITNILVSTLFSYFSTQLSPILPQP
ncbi:MAG: type II secretion system F family protein [Thermoprotei archaeon]